MKSHWFRQDIVYDGTQLSPHFTYRHTGVAGDSICAFAGRVNVELSEMVDIEDVRAREAISSDRMLSFIIEIYDVDLTGTVFLQRLFMSILCQLLNKRLGGLAVERRGDDLFYSDRKLSVSIATRSTVSTLIHSALNIKGTGAPIPVSCLEEMGIDPEELARDAMRALCEEVDACRFARVKVRGV